MKIIEVNVKLKAINNDVASFNLNDDIRGIIHAPKHGKVTVVLDGGYVLGKYDCSLCAIDALSDVQVELLISELQSGSTYSEYKKQHIRPAFH